jgi:transmembrane sensor
VNAYVTYTPEELAQDTYFIQWVNATDLAAENFWQNWLETYPFKRRDVELARQIVLLVHQVGESDFTQNEIDEVKTSILEQINYYEKPLFWETFRQKWVWVAAAVIAIGIGLSWNRIVIPKADDTYLVQVQRAKDQYELVEVFNQHNEVQVVNLPDGSSVLLKKEAKISYPKAFTKEFREVYLVGEAFFEIAKDHNKPFFVHANQVITKVLGTSFTVKTFSDSPKVTVNVKTGRVAVFLADSEEGIKQKQNKKLEGFVLSPGEQVVVNEGSIGVIQAQSLPSSSGSSTIVPIERLSFEFNETSLKDVFSRIEQSYHLKVEYDDQLMGNCPVTASLTDEPLNQKLHLICKAVRANYILTEGKIVVTGQGCQ